MAQYILFLVILFVYLGFTGVFLQFSAPRQSSEGLAQAAATLTVAVRMRDRLLRQEPRDHHAAARGGAEQLLEMSSVPQQRARTPVSDRA